jgi:hypothetical protein
MQPIATFTLAAFVVLAGSGLPARAAAEARNEAREPAPGQGSEQGWIEGGGGLGLRDDQLIGPRADVSAKGHTGSNAELRAAWFPGARRLGVAAAIAAEWFSVTGGERPLRGDGIDDAGAAAQLALALRGASGPALSFEGQVGYTVLQIPVVGLQRSALGAAVAGGYVRTHGPTLVARAAWRPARALGFELGGGIMPRGFGASYEGEDTSVRRWNLGATAVVGALQVAGARWAAVVSYDHARTSASGDSLDLQQAHDQIGVGVRATLPARSTAPHAAHSAPAAPAPDVIVPRELAVLRVVVRERDAVGRETDVPVPGLSVEVTAAGVSRGSSSTDAHGELVLRGLPAGPIELRADRPGWEPTREILAFPAVGEARAGVFVTRARSAGAPASAAVAGLVRADSGVPVAATVAIVELGLERQADADGAFRFDLPPGRYTLTVDAPGFVAQRKPLEIGRTEQQIFDIELKPERP